MTKVIDLSQTIYDNMPVYPGDPPVRVSQVHYLGKQGWRLRQLQLGTHTGTHVDAPSHMDAHGASLDNLPLEAFFGPAQVVDVKDKFPVGIGLAFRQGRLGVKLYDKLKQARPKFILVGDSAELTVELERRLLQAGIITFTDLINMDQLPTKRRFQFFGVPLKIKDGDGSPIRAFAIV